MDKGPDEVKIDKVNTKLPQSFWNFSDKNAAEIQREIRTTRAELDETVHAIQERLAPQQFINHVSDMARDLVRQGSPKVIEAIRNNPLPSSLVVLGLGWLFIRGSAGPQWRVRRSARRYDTLAEDEYGLMSEGQFSAIEETDMTAGTIESGYEKGKQWSSEAAQRIKDKTSQWTGQAKSKASQFGSQAREKASSMAGQARDKASHMASGVMHKASDTASSVLHKAGDVASHMATGTKDKASQLASTTVEKAGQLAGATRAKAGDWAHSTMGMTSNVAHKAGEQARHLGTAAQGQLKRAGDGTQRMFQANPGAFALLCIGVGAALAMGLSTTRKERELMGAQSDELKEKLKETGQQTLGKVENILAAGQQAAMEEARKENVI